MSDELANLFRSYDNGGISRRQLLTALGLAGVVVTRPISAFAQGSCKGRPADQTPQCDKTPAKSPFEPTGWKTVWLDHFSMQVADYQKEAAYFAALMNWKVRSDDGTKALLDIGDDVGGFLIRGGYQAPAPAAPPATPPAGAAANGAAGRGGAGGGAAAGGAGRGGGQRTPRLSVVDGFCWGIEPWNAKKVEAELAKRGLKPVADNDSKNNFESFHVLDPGGFDLQISNGNRKNRRSKPATGKTTAPFEATNWKTVWLDHISFQCPDYKTSVAFYEALLGWKPTGDEGSQNEVEIGDVGNALLRGLNMSPAAVADRAANPAGGGRGGRGGATKASIDHIAFGMQPWDPEVVQAELIKRGLNWSFDTGGKGNDMESMKKSPYASYHTTTPNGFTLQISKTTKDTRNVR